MQRWRYCSRTLSAIVSLWWCDSANKSSMSGSSGAVACSEVCWSLIAKVPRISPPSVNTRKREALFRRATILCEKTAPPHSLQWDLCVDATGVPVHRGVRQTSWTWINFYHAAMRCHPATCCGSQSKTNWHSWQIPLWLRVHAGAVNSVLRLLCRHRHSTEAAANVLLTLRYAFLCRHEHHIFTVSPSSSWICYSNWSFICS